MIDKVNLLSPGTILTLYLLSKCTNFYTMPSKFDTDNYSPIHYPETFHTLYKCVGGWGLGRGTGYSTHTLGYCFSVTYISARSK